ncbi:MAG: hypothetical protein A3F12_01580 [Gammaproteobacteria bacterium RIFCSPHIGHO2_12_FULL_38_14]|nr:MAG: hypothetical protein A3F12_01580 [Gammaproteobacteria bacterium RIFCSPHIGHO2_12_FULL_38_14]
MNYATLIPELAVTDCEKSIIFYRDTLGFNVAYERKDEGFAFLEHDGAQLMLDEIGHRQFIGTDPDGYLLRFYEEIGIRKCTF